VIGAKARYGSVMCIMSPATVFAYQPHRLSLQSQYHLARTEKLSGAKIQAELA